MIRIEDVTKTYSSSGQVTRIGPVSLELPAGGVTAFIGPNGAGKSTLLTMTGRLLEPDSGRITVGGLDVSRAPAAELARTVSILRQENHFVSRLTVRQLVGFGRFPYSRGRLTATDEAVVERAISFLGLEELAGRFLDELSGGQRQRAYVSMVLTQETDYVLLDEPLNNLDIARAVEMMRLLRQAATELGRTVVIVLHDVNIAARYADRIIAMKNGQVAYNGTPEQIMRDEVLTDVFGTEITVVPGPDGPLACYR